MMNSIVSRTAAVLAVGILAANALAADKPTTLDRSCMSAGCHDGYFLKEYGHGPVLLGDCHSCHEPANVEKHEFEFIRRGEELCTFCHLEQTAHKNVHEPVQAGDCTQCHDPHASEHKSLLRKATVGESCADCHNVTENDLHLHGPTAVGQCTICHDPHSSDHAMLIRTKPEELCFSCHEITQDEMQKFEFVHEPATGQCTGCHDPHGADNWQMLKARAPQMCYSCHEDIEKIAQHAVHKHTVVNSEDGCLTCHTPHASTVKNILKSDPVSLCLDCHDEPVGVSQDDVIPAFSEQIQGKKYLHGPVSDNDCSGCHMTHGSEHFRLLKEQYPPLFYAPFQVENYELCFSCHERTLVLDVHTSNLTDFRNGDLNLHFLHVNKDRRGRTCRACHQTHGSNQPKHIRETVPYGTWELPINFAKTDTGGSCQPGCHIPKTYDRDSAVDYSVAAGKPQQETSADAAAASTAQPVRTAAN